MREIKEFANAVFFIRKTIYITDISVRFRMIMKEIF